MTNQQLLPPSALDQAALQQAQATNLAWCENWAGTLPTVEGVPIAKALTFDLIGLLNRVEVEEIVGRDQRAKAMKEVIRQMTPVDDQGPDLTGAEWKPRKKRTKK